MASDLKRQKIKNKQTKEKNKFRNKIFDFTFFKYYVCGLHREHKVFYIKHYHFSKCSHFQCELQHFNCIVQNLLQSISSTVNVSPCELMTEGDLQYVDKTLRSTVKVTKKPGKIL